MSMFCWVYWEWNNGQLCGWEVMWERCCSNGWSQRHSVRKLLQGGWTGSKVNWCHKQNTAIFGPISHSTSRDGLFVLPARIGMTSSPWTDSRARTRSVAKAWQGSMLSVHEEHSNEWSIMKIGEETAELQEVKDNPESFFTWLFLFEYILGDGDVASSGVLARLRVDRRSSSR